MYASGFLKAGYIKAVTQRSKSKKRIVSVKFREKKMNQIAPVAEEPLDNVVNNTQSAT